MGKVVHRVFAVAAEKLGVFDAVQGGVFPGVLHRGGIGVLRGEAVLEGEHLPAGDVGQLGGQNTGIARLPLV